jgi:hypothetical protein
MPRDKASLKQWSRCDVESETVLQQEILPISTTITGNVAVVQYCYMLARENYKKERETVTGHYTDVLMKDGGRWQFIAWAGGEDPTSIGRRHAPQQTTPSWRRGCSAGPATRDRT